MNLFYSFSVISTLLFVSCSSEPLMQQQVDEKPVIIKKAEVKVDSTAYYDSVFAPNAFKIDTFFQRRFEEKTFNGTILFAKNKHTIIKKAYGFSTLETKDSLTTSSTFQLASVSKTFTAIACLKLVEKGIIKLTDSVEKYIPEFPYQGVTIHQLLSHRSGLGEYTHFCDAPDSIWSDKHKSITNNNVLNIIKKYIPGINYAPDTKFYYCNTNYLLLASVIESASGQQFEEFLQENIFTPLKMNSTVIYNRENKDDLVNPVTAYNGAYSPFIDIYLNGVVGDKGVYSSVEDMLLFYKGLTTNKLLKPETLKLAMTPQSSLQKDKKNYGYGFRLIEVEEDKQIVYHTGWWKGFRTYFVMNNELNEVAIVLTNLKRGPFLSVEELISLID